MTVRTRKGGVYDWDVPRTPGLTKRQLRTEVPVYREDSIVQRRTVRTRCVLTAAPVWDNRGRRKVRMGYNGRAVGEIKRNGTFRLYGANFADGQDRHGTWKTFQGGLRAMGDMI